MVDALSKLLSSSKEKAALEPACRLCSELCRVGGREAVDAVAAANEGALVTSLVRLLKGFGDAVIDNM